MKAISNWQEFIKNSQIDIAKTDIDKDVLSFMKNAEVLAVAGTMLVDEIKHYRTDILLTAYESGGYVWDSRDIYYYEHYGMPLDKDFVKYAIKQ